MDGINTFEPYDTALDTIDQAQIDQVLRDMEWEAQINATEEDFDLPNTNHTHYCPLSGYTTIEECVAPISRQASPGSLTTGSTNPSPLVPLLDYDLGFDIPVTIGNSQPMCLKDMALPVELQDDRPAEALGFAQDFDLPAFSGPASCSDNVASFSPVSGNALRQPPTWDALTMQYYTCNITLDAGPSASSDPPISSGIFEAPSSATRQKSHLACPHCSDTFADKTKLKVHTNKHTKPFRCSADGCDYSTAEKKSLKRHLLAKLKWDDEHRLAAQNYGLREVKYRCSNSGCTYSTIREDNLKRHMTTCF